MNNMNLNNILPIVLGGTTLEELPRSNRAMYLSASSIIPNNPGYIIVSSAAMWIAKGGTINDPEYTILSKYFAGFNPQGGQAKAPPSSAVIGKRMTGNAASITSGEVDNGVVAQIVAIDPHNALQITFNIGGNVVTLTIDCTGLTSQDQLANLIQAQLRLWGPVGNKGKAPVTPLFPNATCTWNGNSNTFTVLTSNSSNSIVINYCTDDGANTLSQLMAFTELKNATLSNGQLGMTLQENMQYFMNKGIMSFCGFKSTYFTDTNPAEYNSGCDFSEDENKKYNYYLVVKLSNLQTVLDSLVASGRWEQYEDSFGQIRYTPKSGVAMQLEILIDGVDATGVTRTQANDYSNSICAETIVASGNPFADTNAYCRNANATVFDDVSSAVITEDEHSLILRCGGIAYITFAGNTGVFYQTDGSGRNTKDLIYLDYWFNLLFSAYRMQYECLKLLRGGRLTIGNANSILTQAYQNCAKAGFFNPRNNLDYQNNSRDRRFVTYAALREFGVANDSTMQQVQSSLNSGGYSFNVVPYDQMFNTQLGFIAFVHLMGNSENSAYIKKVRNSIIESGRIPVIVNQISEEKLRDISNFKNKKLTDTNTHKATIINYNTNKSDIIDHELYLETYEPDTLREEGLVNLGDIIPVQSFNKVINNLNQLNL